MNKPNELPDLGQWHDHTHVPFQVYSDEAIYRRELDEYFYGPFWHPVALQAEIPNVNDYKSLYIGETPVIAVHSAEGEFSVMVNACAHRGVQLTAEFLGAAEGFTCPYHGWVFKNDGSLLSTIGEECFPTDFDRNEYNLKNLRVETFCGVVFATFDPAAPSLDEFLGNLKPHLKVVVGGGERPLKLLGYQKITFNTNWKLFMDNDGYHAGILHAAFRLLDFAGGGGYLEADGHYGHWGMNYQSKDYEDNGYLNDPSVVESRSGEQTAAGACVRPVTQAVRHMDSINFRFARPMGPNKTEVHYTYFGFDDDDPDLLNHRVRQGSNLLGPSGFISIEDSSIFDRGQKAMGYTGGQMNFLKGMGSNPDINRSSQNDESVSTVFWADYKSRMGF